MKKKGKKDTHTHELSISFFSSFEMKSFTKFSLRERFIQHEIFRRFIDVEN